MTNTPFNKEKKEPKQQIIYGKHPVLEALQTGVAMDKILLQQGTRGDFEKEIRHLCKQQHVPLQVTPKERLFKITRKNHQGIIGFQALISYYKLEDLLPMVYEKSEIPLFLLLDGVTDVRNFGAIARSAACCGVHGMVISKKNAAPINAEAIKTSAGTLNKMPVCRESSLLTAIDFLQLSGIQVFVSDLTASETIDKMDFTQPTALVIGAEGKGVSRAILQKVNSKFIIPQTNMTDSFNVSVASGIMLYEVMRQRSH